MSDFDPNAGAQVDTQDPSLGGAGDGGDGNTPAATPIKLSDDTLVEVDGKAIPYREYLSTHTKGLQGQLTRHAQTAAQYQRELQTAREIIADRERRLAEGTRGGTPKPDPNKDLIEALKTRTHLTGAEAAQLVEHLTGQTKTFESALATRDQALLTIAKYVQGLSGTIKGQNERNTQADFDTKINRWLSDGKYPAEVKDLMAEVYLAYEGDNLDEEFPALFKSRFETVAKAVRAMDKRVAEESRRKPFVPMRGGNGAVSKPLNLANKSAKEIADTVWEGMVKGSPEE